MISQKKTNKRTNRLFFILINISGASSFTPLYILSACQVSYLFAFYFLLKFAAPHCTKGLWFFSVRRDKEQLASSNGLLLTEQSIYFVADVYWGHGNMSTACVHDIPRSFVVTAYCFRTHQHPLSRVKRLKAFIDSDVFERNIWLKFQASHPS